MGCWIVRGLIWVGVLLGGCDYFSTATDPFDSRDNRSDNVIAFASERDGNFEIYLVEDNGDQLTRLTDHPGADRAPTWAPDAAKLAFSGRRDLEGGEVYVVDYQGVSAENITRFPSGEFNAAWSPLGDKIVFDAGRNGNRDLFVMDADGSGQVQLTDHRADDLHPTWSPDGERIAFASGREVYIKPGVAVDPGEVLALEASLIAANQAARAENDSSFTLQIYTVAATGGPAVRLTFNPATDTEPAWSPRGDKIAFVSERDGDREIYLMNPDGSEQVNLSRNPAQDSSPTWSPEGNRLAFVSDRDGGRDIFIISINGGGARNITQNFAADIEPAWMPRIGLDTATPCLLCPGRGGPQLGF